jgi:hypothetical protein
MTGVATILARSAVAQIICCRSFLIAERFARHSASAGLLQLLQHGGGDGFRQNSLRVRSR